MTDKEMHKLSRRELLQLLLAQVSETEDLKGQLAERDGQLTELRRNYEKLRNRLDQKDAKIHELRDTLRKARTTRRIELEEAGSIAEAALRLNGIFDLAQKAADQYLENVKRLYEGDLLDSEIRERLDDIEEEDGWEMPEESAERPPAEEPAGEAAGEKPEEEASPEPTDELEEELLAEQAQNSAEGLLEAPEAGSGEAAAAGTPEAGSGEAAVTEELEIGEDAPIEFMEQDGQRELWEEKGKKKRKSRWRRRALSR